MFKNLMFKRVLIIGLLGIGLVLLGTEAVAHYQGYVAGKHVTSVLCTLGIRGVQNPATHPGASECVLTDVQVESKCINPAGNEVSGTSAFQDPLVATAQITQDDIVGKGKAMTVLTVSDDPVCNSEVACVNPNWQLTACLFRSFTAHDNVYTCVGPDADPCSVRELASTVESNCVLPARFTIDDLPPSGTAFDCDVGRFEHVD